MTTIPIPDINLGAIGPELILTITAALLLLLEVFATKKGKDKLGYIALGGVLVAGILTAQMRDMSFTTFSGMYVVDNFSTFFKLTFLLAVGLTILMSVKYIKDEKVDGGEYYALLLFATVGMFFLASGENMMTIYMGLEVMSISLYVLAGYTRRRSASNEASLKYLLLGGFSSAIFIYGIALVYGATGNSSLSMIGDAIKAGTGNDAILATGVILMLVGLAFKVSAVPFHMWTPDVYQGAPIPVTAFMSAGPKAAAFAALLRLLAEAFPELRAEWWQIIWILSVLTMTFGNIIALVQENVKRMLAYSSIAHAGYILIGVVTASKVGVSGVLFYLLAYTFMNIGAFAVVSVVIGRNENRSTFSDFTGLGYRNPLLAATLTLMLFSLAGIPPMAGFVGKFYIFMAAMQEGFIYLAIIGVVNSVISVFFYLKLTVYMYLKEDKVVEERLSANKLSFSPALIAALVLSVYGVLWIGVNPSGYIEFAKSAFLTF